MKEIWGIKIDGAKLAADVSERIIKDDYRMCFTSGCGHEIIIKVSLQGVDSEEEIRECLRRYLPEILANNG